MKLFITSMGSDPHRKNKRTFSLPFGGNEERHWFVGVDLPKESNKLLPENQPPQELRYYEHHYVLSVPPGAVVNSDPDKLKSCSLDSNAEYLVQHDEVIQGVHCGWLLQLLEAHPRHSRELFNRRAHWSAWASPQSSPVETSRHYHLGDGNGYPGPTEWFFPVFGACDIWLNRWEKLMRQTQVAPGVVHQLRAENFAINLLIMYDIRDPAGVRSTKNHAYCH